MRVCSILTAATCVVGPAVMTVAMPAPAGAQEPYMLENFMNLATYSVGIPIGDTKHYVSGPSWAGIGWEGQWAIRSRTSAGVSIGLQDFYRQSFTTSNFPAGSATGEQLRDLLLTNFMATARWYPEWFGPIGAYVAFGAGGMYAQQYYQLALSSQFSRSALHFAVAPEGGVAIPVMDGIAAVVSLRYMIPNSTGNYIGGGARSFRMATLNLGVAER